MMTLMLIKDNVEDITFCDIIQTTQINVVLHNDDMKVT